MGPAEIVTTIGAAVIIGGLIGSVGIGGVLLVPWLTAVAGFAVRDAVAIAMASYVATGLVAVLQARFSEGSAALVRFWPLILSTLPGALLGGLFIGVVPDRPALFILAVFLILSGLWSLARRYLQQSQGSGTAGWVIGLFGGFTSSVTGTGGPAVLIPILLWRGVPLLAAIALGQFVQLPIALAATVGNLAMGPVDLWTAAMLGAALAPGVLIGRWTARRLPIDVLTSIVAVVLIATGLLLAFRAAQ